MFPSPTQPFDHQGALPTYKSLDYALQAIQLEGFQSNKNHSRVSMGTARKAIGDMTTPGSGESDSNAKDSPEHSPVWTPEWAILFLR